MAAHGAVPNQGRRSLLGKASNKQSKVHVESNLLQKIEKL